MKPPLGVLLSFTLSIQSFLPSLSQAAENNTEFHPLDLLDYYPPSDLAHVADSYVAPSSTAPLVILIQDLHAHPGVQRKISGLLNYYASQGISQNFVAVEGAEGPVDTTLMSLFPNEAIKKQVTEEFVDKGLFTGMEEHAILNKKPHYLYGAENGETYRLHKSFFQKSYEGRSSLASEIQNLQKRLEALEPKVYSKSLLTLKESARDYEEGKFTLEKYLKRLESKAEDLKIPYPIELSTMQDLLKQEKSLRKENLQQETKSFLTLLHPRLTQEEIDRLTRYDKTNASVYYLYLHDLSRQHQLLEACPKNLKAYLIYQRAMETQDLTRFQSALEDLNQSIFLAQAKTKPQKNLIQAQEDLKLLQDLLECKLTEDQFKSLLPRANDLLAVLSSLLSPSPPVGEGGGEGGLRELVREAIDFYALALMRDKPLVEKTLVKLKSSSSSTAILVTGGFHTPGIARILKEREISYLTLSPPVDSYSPEDQERYVKFLLEQDPAQSTLAVGIKIKTQLQAATLALSLLLTRELAAQPQSAQDTAGAVSKINIELAQAYSNTTTGVQLKPDPKTNAVRVEFTNRPDRPQLNISQAEATFPTSHDDFAILDELIGRGFSPRQAQTIVKEQKLLISRLMPNMPETEIRALHLRVYPDTFWNRIFHSLKIQIFLAASVTGLFLSRFLLQRYFKKGLFFNFKPKTSVQRALCGLAFGLLFLPCIIALSTVLQNTLFISGAMDPISKVTFISRNLSNEVCVHETAHNLYSKIRHGISRRPDVIYAFGQLRVLELEGRESLLKQYKPSDIALAEEAFAIGQNAKNPDLAWKYLGALAELISEGKTLEEAKSLVETLWEYERLIKSDPSLEGNASLKSAFLALSGIYGHDVRFKRGLELEFFDTAEILRRSRLILPDSEANLETLRIIRKEIGLDLRDDTYFDFFARFVVPNKEIASLLRDKRFVHFFHKLEAQKNPYYRIGTGNISSLPILAELYAELVQRPGKDGSEILFSPKFLNTWAFLDKKYNRMNFFRYESISAVLHIVERVDLETLEKAISKLEKEGTEIFLNDVVILSDVLSNPSLTALLGNRSALEARVRPIYDRPFLATKRSEAAGQQDPESAKTRSPLEDFSNLTLLRIAFLDQSLHDSDFQEKLGEAILGDIQDTSTEWGGVIRYSNGTLKLKQIPSYPKADTSFRPIRNMEFMNGWLAYHQHAPKGIDSSRGAGPSGSLHGWGGDITTAFMNNSVEVVFTPVGHPVDPSGKVDPTKVKINIDLYQVDQKPSKPRLNILDMGIIEVPLKPAVKVQPKPKTSACLNVRSLIRPALAALFIGALMVLSGTFVDLHDVDSLVAAGFGHFSGNTENSTEKREWPWAQVTREELKFITRSARRLRDDLIGRHEFQGVKKEILINRKHPPNTETSMSLVYDEPALPADVQRAIRAHVRPIARPAPRFPLEFIIDEEVLQVWIYWNEKVDIETLCRDLAYHIGASVGVTEEGDLDLKNTFSSLVRAKLFHGGKLERSFKNITLLFLVALLGMGLIFQSGAMEFFTALLGFDATGTANDHLWNVMRQWNPQNHQALIPADQGPSQILMGLVGGVSAQGKTARERAEALRALSAAG